MHLRSSHLGGRYNSASVHITSGSTAGNHFSEPLIRPPAMLLLSHLITQICVPVNVLSMMAKGKKHTKLYPVYRGMWRHISVSFVEVLTIGIDTLVRCNAEYTGV